MKSLIFLFLVFPFGALATTTSYLQVSANQFRAEVDDATAAANSSMARPEYHGEWIKMVPGTSPALPVSMKLDASVELPDTALITGFVCYIQDNDAVVNIDATSQAVLRVRHPSTGVTSVIAQALIGRPGPGIVAVNANTIRTTVDVSTAIYDVELTWVQSVLPATLTDLQFRGCRVQYDL